MLWVMLLLLSVPLFAQPSCPATPAWSPCDLVFDLEATRRENAYLRQMLESNSEEGST